MPKSKKIEEKTKKVETKDVEEKEILLDDEDKVVDPDTDIADDIISEDEEEDGLLDADEVDPFKDKWEE